MAAHFSQFVGKSYTAQSGIKTKKFLEKNENIYKTANY